MVSTVDLKLFAVHSTLLRLLGIQQKGGFILKDVVFGLLHA